MSRATWVRIPLGVEILGSHLAILHGTELVSALIHELLISSVVV